MLLFAFVLQLIPQQYQKVLLQTLMVDNNLITSNFSINLQIQIVTDSKTQNFSPQIWYVDFTNGRKRIDKTVDGISVTTYQFFTNVSK